MGYKTTIFPYWHYKEYPKEDGIYLIYWMWNESPHYDVAAYECSSETWWFPGSHLYNDLKINAWQELPCAPKGV